MKIILVNYHYFISSVPERYHFNIKEILERHGHEVIPFSVKSGRNLPDDYEKYFLDIVDDEVYYAQVKKEDHADDYRVIYKGGCSILSRPSVRCVS